MVEPRVVIPRTTVRFRPCTQKGVDMESGIYALYWWEQDLVYIGQAQKFSARFNEHKRKLKAGTHPNYRVQDTYNLYGEPDYIKLEICAIENLNDLEIIWTAEFNSIKTPWGLNLVEAGKIGYGANSAASKYSKSQVLKAFSLLYRTTKSIAEISSRVKVPKHLVSDIAQGRAHRWVYELYPLKVVKLSQNNNIREGSLPTLKVRTGRVAKLLSPEKVLYEVSSIKYFCENILESNNTLKARIKGISRLLNKDSKSYKGWTLHTN